MQTHIGDVRGMLQRWARIDTDHVRNSREAFPDGAHYEIEHRLLRLAVVSEVAPRTNLQFAVEVELAPKVSSTRKRKAQGPWAAGTGYGSGREASVTAWDPAAHALAKKAKDNEVGLSARAVCAVRAMCVVPAVCVPSLLCVCRPCCVCAVPVCVCRA